MHGIGTGRTFWSGRTAHNLISPAGKKLGTTRETTFDRITNILFPVIDRDQGSNSWRISHDDRELSAKS
jgi:hypothetical protein